VTDQIRLAPGYFRKLATLLLRVIAVADVFYAIINGISLARWGDEVSGSTLATMWIGPIVCALGGLLLWFLSVPLGRLLARGLDESA